MRSDRLRHGALAVGAFLLFLTGFSLQSSAEISSCIYYIPNSWVPCTGPSCPPGSERLQTCPAGDIRGCVCLREGEHIRIVAPPPGCIDRCRASRLYAPFCPTGPSWVCRAFVQRWCTDSCRQCAVRCNAEVNFCLRTAVPSWICRAKRGPCYRQCGGAIGF